METKTEKIKLNRKMFSVEASLVGRLEKSVTPEILRMQEELRSVTNQVKNFPK